MKVVEKRKISYIISLTVICLGLIFMAYNGLVKKTGIFNFGIDFKGGTVVEVDLGQESNIDEVKDLVLNVTGDTNAQVQEVIDSTHVIVKLSAEDKKELKIWLKALIGRNLYGDEAFYPVINASDKVILKALEVIK